MDTSKRYDEFTQTRDPAGAGGEPPGLRGPEGVEGTEPNRHHCRTVWVERLTREMGLEGTIRGRWTGGSETSRRSDRISSGSRT